MIEANTIRDPGPNELYPTPSLRLCKRYVLTRRKGKGGMGEVWQAIDTKLQQLVAIKFLHRLVLSPDSPEGRAALAEFNREVDALRSVKRGVVQLLDKGILPGGRLFFVMEWLEGVSLDKVLRKRRLSQEESLALLGQVARTLQEAHSKGVIHRDIKPSNIFVQRTAGENEYRLVDFGVAKRTDAAHTTTSFSGTFRYAAPEQIRGRVSFSSDLYSLGVVVWEAVTGSQLFHGDELEVIGQKASKDWQPPPWPSDAHVVDDLQVLLRNLVSTDPEQRIVGSASELLEHLVRIQKGLVVSELSEDGVHDIGQDVDAQSAEPSERPSYSSHSPIPFVSVSASLLLVLSSAWLALNSYPVRLEFVSRTPGIKVYGEKDDEFLCDMIPNTSCTEDCEESCGVELPFSVFSVGFIFKGPSYISERVPLRPMFSQRVEVKFERRGREVVTASKTNREMSKISGGESLLGCRDLDRSCGRYEKPAHKVRISSFEIERTEVTVAAYKKCVESGQCEPLPRGSSCNHMKEGRDNHPINCVSWYQARQYCTVHGMRLPTEAEWERAARKKEVDIYPWGNANPSEKRALFGGDWNSGTKEVKSYPVAANGLFGMAGNVSEWVEDCYEENIYKSRSQDSEAGLEIINPVNAPHECASRVRGLRGGAFTSVPSELRVSYRGKRSSDYWSRLIGFRCVLGGSELTSKKDAAK